MVTTVQTIRGWLARAKEKGATHLVVRCDTFDWSDYPVPAFSEDDARAKAEHPGEMQKTMEVYNLALDWDEQLAERRARHF